MHPKDKVKAHLDKSIISSILQNARASLKEPSRPFTPSDQPRSLFSNSEVTRPPSSYNLKTFSKELEPIKAKQIQLEVPLVTGRKTVNEGVKSGPRKPVKVLYTSEKVDRIVFDGPEVLESEEKLEKGVKGEKGGKGGKGEKIGEILKNEAFDEEETSQWAAVIRKIDLIRYDAGFRDTLDGEVLDEILQEFTEALAEVTYNPDPSGLVSCKVLMKNLAMSLEALQGDLGKVFKVCRCLLENVTTHNLLMVKSRKKGKATSPLAVGAIKYIYQFSKKSENDLKFLNEEMIETLYSVLLSIMSEDSYQSIDLPYEFLIYLLGTLKNVTNNKEVSQACCKFFNVFTSLLPNPYLQEAPIPSSKHSELLVQVTGIIKNLISDSVLETVLEFQILEKLAVVIYLYKDAEVQLNSYKALAKVSRQEVVSATLRNFMQVFSETLENSTDVQVLTRALYVQANILSAFPMTIEISFNNIFYFWVKTIGSTDLMELDLLIKITRFATNLLSSKTYPITCSFASELMKNLIETLTRYPVSSHEELVLNTVSCTSNLLYYDFPSQKLISEHFQICALSKVSSLLVESFNEELIVEVLRTISNLTRHDHVCKQLPSLYLIEIFLMMLGHSNWQIVYFTLGCLINVSGTAKEVIFTERVFEALIETLEDVESSEPQFCEQVMMILCNLCTPGHGLVPWESVAGEENVQKLNEIIKRTLEKAQTGQASFLQVAKDLFDFMPKPWTACQVQGCGRKFPNKQQLEEHMKRRHNNIDN